MMESWEIDLRNEEERQRVAEVAFERAIEAVHDDCETELEIIAGSIMHYAELYCVDADKLLRAIVDEYL